MKAGRRNKKLKAGRGRNKKRQNDRKEEGERRREEEKNTCSAGFKLVSSVLLFFLSVEREGVVARIGFTFLPS